MTKTSKKLCKALSLALALLLLLGLLPVMPAAEAVGETVSISTEKELKDFIKKCSMDSYSKNLSPCPSSMAALTAAATRYPTSPSK